MPDLPSLSDLTARIAHCIGIWETNRGKDRPNPKESSLDTVCGVRASMATIEQATMPYAIDALKRFASLRAKVNPPLTKKEIDDAEACCGAVKNLLELVSRAVADGISPAQFVETRSSEIARTNLSEADVAIMFKAVALKQRIDAAHMVVRASPDKLDAQVAGIAAADRLGLGNGSLRSYVRKPEFWGENRAAWQRKAINAMGGSIGDRIRMIAESDNGTAFAIPVVQSRLEKELKKTPVPPLERLVIAVGRQNNPGEAQYGENIWATYKRVFAT